MPNDNQMDRMVQQMHAKADEMAKQAEYALKPKHDAMDKLSAHVRKGTFKAHPQADIFPMIEGKERKELLQSIRDNGIMQKLAIDKLGRVVDGRNRMACFIELTQAGEKVRTPEIVLVADKDVPTYVMSANIHRRHLTKQQRAAIIALTTEKMTPKESGKLGRDIQMGSAGHSGKPETPKSDKERAKEAGIGKDLVTEARKQPKEVLEKVVRGEAKMPAQRKAKPAAKSPDKELAEAIKTHSNKVRLVKIAFAEMTDEEKTQIVELALDWHASVPGNNN